MRLRLLAILLAFPVPALAATGQATGRPVEVDVSSRPVQATGTTTARTLKDRFADVVNVKDFGAKANATWTGSAWTGTDDRAAVQAAIDSVKPTYSNTDSNGFKNSTPATIVLPNRTVGLSGPLVIYSGQRIVGSGPGSKLAALSGFTGTALITGGVNNGTYLQQIGIRDLSLEGTQTGLWAIDLSTVANVLQADVRRVRIATQNGIKADSYTQDSLIEDVLVVGSAIDQVLSLRGNVNRIVRLDKEGGSVTDAGHTVPYVLVQGNADGSRASGNRFVECIIEGTGSAYKSAIKLDGTSGTVLDGVWIETSASDGYGLRVNNSSNVQMVGVQPIRDTGIVGRKIQLTNSSSLVADALHVAYDQYSKINDAIEVDATSRIMRASVAYSRYGRNITRLGDLATVRWDADLSYDLELTPQTGIQSVNYPRGTVASQNLFTNGGFEIGRYGWTMDAAIAAVTSVVASEVVPSSNALQIAFPDTTSRQVYQSITISAAQAGVPIAFASWVKLTGPGKLTTWSSGAGVTGSYQSDRYVQNGDGWVLLTKTVVPQSAGTLQLGYWIIGPDATSVLMLDGATATVGVDNQIQAGRFGTIDVGGRTIVTSTAAPSVGTFKQGDVVFNSTPAAGSAFAWRATAAGTPGTFEAIPVPLRGTAVIDFGAIPATSCAADRDITVTGAVVGAECIPGLPSTTASAVVASCYVSGANNVKLRLCNPTTSAASDPPSDTYSARVFNP